MSKYTPSTEDVRQQYRSPVDAWFDREEFDRWFASERASVFTMAYLMGASHALLRVTPLEPDNYNPY